MKNPATARGAKLSILLAAFMLLQLFTPFAVWAENEEPWTATPYHREDGTVVEGLEQAVAGKSHWLETTAPLPVVVKEEDGVLTMGNGVISRSFVLPQEGGTAFYTSSYRNDYVEKELHDGKVQPDVIIGLYDVPYEEIYKDEGIKVVVDPVEASRNTIEIPEGNIKYPPDYYFIGGKDSENAFVFDGYTVSGCEKPFEWEPHAIYGDPAAEDWPPKGKHVEFNFSAPDTSPEAYRGVKVKVIYEMYDNLSAMKKRVEVTNTGDNLVMVGRIAPEILSGNDNMDELLGLESSYTCGDQSTLPINMSLPCKCALEKDDSPFKALENLTHTCYEVGPAYELEKGQTFATFDTYEIIHSTYWFELRMRERLGMYRKLFPWITDNPLTMHNTGALTKDIIDHAVEAKYEMIIQSYSAPDSSAQMLTRDQARLDQYKELIDYAHSKGLTIGIYQAQYTRGQYKGGAEYGTNGVGQWNTWCLASAAFDDYWDNFKYFVQYTGVDCVEIDGTYPGCYCNNGEHHVNADKETDPDPEGIDKAAGTPSKYAVHKGFFDAQVKQWENAVRMMSKEFRDMGVYIKVPAWYYMNGGNKCGIGYEEVAWSQPRQEQLLYGRQLMHNASYARTMSMSWSHIPFAQYQGGGSDAMFQPFKQNKEDYNWVIAQNLGNGVTSDFRGPALFDDETQGILNRWVSFYQRYRGIVNSDMVHIAQATYDEKGANKKRGVKMDTLFHVNANNPGEKGLLWVYNQTDEPRTETITVPMYYTGLTGLNYPPVPLKGSMGKDVHAYGIYPPNYDWLPDSEPHYQLPNAQDTGRNASFVRGGVEVQDISIDSNGNALLTVTLQPMSFTYYAIYSTTDVPDVSLEVGQVKNAAGKWASENKAAFGWDKDVSLKLTENGVPNENPAITIDHYNVYRDGKLLGRSLTNEYTDTGLAENTQYTYTVSAVASGVEGPQSEALAITTSADATKPALAGATAMAGNTILLRFSETVDKATAEDTANYSLSGGKVVLSAEADGDEVVLTVEELDALASYTLAVSGIKDVSSAGNTMDAAEVKVIYGYVAKYSFADTAAGKITDAFGMYDGSIYNAEAVGRQYATLARFDGTNGSYGDLGSGLLTGRTEYSASLWFNPASAIGKQVLLSQGQENVPEDDITLWVESDVLYFRASDIDGSAAELSGGVVQAGSWNLATVVRKGESFSLYLNDTLVDSVSVPGIQATNTQNALLLGAQKNHAGGERTFFFTGVMSEAVLYSIPLDEEKITELYASNLVSLGDLLLSAKSIDREIYTEDSYNALQAVVAEIDAANPAAMVPGEIIAAKHKLESAIAALVKNPAYASLLALYHMDEAEGNEMANALPGHGGTFYNGDYLRIGTPFKRGAYMSVKFGSYIGIPASPLSGAVDFTVAGWFKSQLGVSEAMSLAGKQVLFADDSGNIILSLADDKMTLEVAAGGEPLVLTADKPIATEVVTGETRQAWNHFAVARQGDAFTLWQNGEAVATGKLADVAAGGSLTIGAKAKTGGGTENQYNGLVDEFAFYGEALEAERISELADAIPFRKSALTNLALNKTLMSDNMTDAFRINDGKVLDKASTDTPWTARSSGTVSDKGLKYGFDLGEEYEITALSLTQFYRNYNNVELRRFRDVVIQISTSKDFSSGVTTVFNTDETNRMGYGPGSDKTYYSFELGNDILLDAPVRGRYVRLISNGYYTQNGSYAGYVNMAELEVYGDIPAPELPELTVSRDEITLVAAGDREFAAITTDSGASAGDVVVATGHDEVATVANQSGVIQVTAVGKGETTLTLTHPDDPELTKEITVTVLGLESAETINDEDPAIRYTNASWQLHNTGRGADPQGVYEYMRGIHFTATIGATAEYTFTGTGIDVITTVNIDQGAAEVWLDGELQAVVQTQAPNPVYPKRANQMCIFSTTGLGYGQHTIKLVNHQLDPPLSTSGMTVDAFRVYRETPPADKTELQKLYDSVRDYKEETYTQSSWAAFAAALETAAKVLAKEDAGYEEIHSALEALQQAADTLAPRGDTGLLAIWVDLFSKLEEVKDNYTAESWTAMEAALATARTLLAAPEDASAPAVESALDALFAAENGLQYAVKAGPLEEALAEARRLLENSGQYIPEAVAALAEKVARAEELLARGNYTQQEILDMTLELIGAISDMLDRGDKTSLQLLVNSAKRLDPTLFTTGSWATAAAALEQAQGVLSNENAVQEQVDNAYAVLEGAIRKLTPAANKTGLHTAILVAQTILDDKGSYVPSTTEGLEAQVASARLVADDDNATQDNVDAAQKALMEKAMAARKTANKDALKNALGKSVRFEGAGFTQSSAEGWQQAIQQAQAVLADENATWAEIEAAMEQLKTAEAALKQQPAQQPDAAPESPAAQTPAVPEPTNTAAPKVNAPAAILPGPSLTGNEPVVQPSIRPDTHAPAAEAEMEQAATDGPAFDAAIPGGPPARPNGVVWSIAILAAAALLLLLWAAMYHKKRHGGN